MKIFLVIVISLLGYLNYLVGVYFVDALSLSGTFETLFWIFNIFATVIIFAAPYVYRVYPKKDPGFLYNALQWCGYILFGIYSVLLVFMFLNLSGIFIYEHLTSVSQKQEFFIKFSLAIVSLVIAAIVSGVGFLEAQRKPLVKKVSVAIPNLPPAFHGVTILQMSDLHVGQTIKAAHVNRLVEMSNELKPDIVVLTGDMIDGIRFQLEEDLEGFKRVQAPLGKFMVPGNHEYYWGVTSWISFWKEVGFSTLLNEHSIIERDQAKLVMAGVHDYSARKLGGGIVSSPKDALKGAPSDAIKILLAHQPRSVYEASSAGFNLQISGHTHSGQYFPFNVLIYLFQPYVKGLNLHKKTWIYVNQGTGYWGPPSRFGVPPELTLLELISHNTIPANGSD